MRFRAITTFNAAGLALYGSRMLELFCRFWPDDIGLSLYVDGFSFAEDDARIMTRDIASIGWLTDFKKRHADNAAAHGQRHGSYNYKFDAVKFAHKTAAWITEAEQCGADVLIWLDGDTVTHAPVPHEFLEPLMPADCAVAWLDRQGLYPETGCIMFNMRHPKTAPMFALWRSLYETDAIFAQDEWNDCCLLQWCARQVDAPAASLSGWAKTTSHPAINGPLGAVLDHCKGPRKNAGRSSSARDLRRPRQESYWN